MAKSQENGTPILIGLEGYEVVTELRKPASSCCDSVKLYRHSRAKKGECFTDGGMVRKSTPKLLVIAGEVAIVDTSSPRV